MWSGLFGTGVRLHEKTGSLTHYEEKEKKKEIKVSPQIGETFDESRQIGKERVQTVTAGLI